MGTDSTPLVTSAREEPPADELLILWQEEPATAASLGDEALRAHAARVARAHRFLRLLRTVQHVGTAFGIVAATAVALRFTDPLMRVGAALLALSFVFRWTILRRTAPTAEATSAGPMVSSEPSLAAYHAALVQRLGEDRGPRLWSRLAVGGPAAALFLYGFARAYPALRSLIALEAVAVAAGLMFAFGSAVRRARRYQAELDALDALDGPVEGGSHAP